MKANVRIRRRSDTGQLDLPVGLPGLPVSGEGKAHTRAIEDEEFPFEALSDIAEAESWRKEVHRPIYYVHKWWARRLGTVFRAITIAALAPAGTDVLKLLYEPVRFAHSVVFDPFMGSGVTLGEALKLGARAIGRDINPVSHFLVRNALRQHDPKLVRQTFESLQSTVAPRIQYYYRAQLKDGSEGQVLYFFWVKTVPCPNCDAAVDLFSSRIFAQHAYPKANPRAQATCPQCGAVVPTRYDAHGETCHSCGCSFDPQSGPAKGQKAHCPKCSHSFSIAKSVKGLGNPPAHRLYAKLVLRLDGRKEYLAADDFDRELYAEACEALAQQPNALPIGKIAPGYNTDQALAYNYSQWHQFFNDRQLLCLSILADAIRPIPDEATRELFACLFSGTLEFNNMFASYKGEGTGAVRHMFAHHILKPERVPLEANLWGTVASSGSFSTLFESRILRALAYAAQPTELRLSGPKSASLKVPDLSEPVGYQLAGSFEEFESRGDRVYISCGDSSRIDLRDENVDVAITDPPFFDNVHYSQLADFFYVWQRHLLPNSTSHRSESTRSRHEVQDEDPMAFTDKLAGVWSECWRVLKHGGLLIFTYHHSRSEGWSAVLKALIVSGFQLVAAHPIKAEMSVAMPKNQAKEPIDLDIIMVCRKRGTVEAAPGGSDWELDVSRSASAQVERFFRSGRRLSRNDVRIIVMAQALRHLTSFTDPTVAVRRMGDWEPRASALIDQLRKG